MKLEAKNELTLAWIVLILGGVFQIGWSIGVDYTEKFTVWYWDLITIFFLALSMVCMEWPMRHGIAFTTAYAVWIGVGVSLTVIVSAILGLDSLNWLSCLFIIIAIGGVVGLKATPVEYLDEKRDEGGKEEAKEERSIHTETHFNPPQGRRRRPPAPSPLPMRRGMFWRHSQWTVCTASVVGYGKPFMVVIGFHPHVLQDSRCG